MKQIPIKLPDNFFKGLMCKVHVSVNGKTDVKELKVCTVKARTITFIEVDRVNRKNIFRKVKVTDVAGVVSNAMCEITLKDGVLPDKWESSWDSIGSPSPNVRNYGRVPVVSGRPFYSTTNSTTGFPIV